MGLNINKQEICEKMIDEIYADILDSLITKKKFEDNIYFTNTMKELDMINIHITEKIYNKLKDILNKNEFVNEYKIFEKEDIKDEKKINFYYILLMYIFKNHLYIYQIDFFLIARQLILKLFRENELDNYLNVKNDLLNEKLNFIIKKLVDSDYYLKKNTIYDNKIKKIKIILEYYKEILFESKKEVIKLIEDIINNNKKIDENLLIDYAEAEIIYKQLPIIKFIFKEKLCEERENEMKKVVKISQKLIKMIKEKKEKKIRADERQMIKKFFLEEKNKNILLEIFEKEAIDIFINYNKSQIEKVLEPKNIKYIDKKEEIKEKVEIKNINENNEKETRECIDLMSNDLNYKSNGSNSTVSGSLINQANIDITNYNAPEPQNSKSPNKPTGNKKDIANIPDFISSVCKISLYTKEKGVEPYLIYKLYYGEHYLEIDYFKLIKYNNALSPTVQGDIITKNLRKFFDYLKEIEKRLIQEFENNYMIQINIKLRKEQENINNNNIYNITADYIFFEPLSHKQLKYKDENILINKTDSNLQGFQFMLYDMNSKKYNKIKYSEENNNYNNGDEEDYEEKDTSNWFNVGRDYEKESNEFCIIDYIKTLGKTKNSIDFVKELSNGSYVVGSQNVLYLYDHQFLEKPQHTLKCRDWIYSICEREIFNEKSNNNKYLQIICCINSNIGLVDITEKKMNLTIIETQSKQSSKKKSKKDKKKNTYNLCIEMNENNYIMGGFRGAFYYHNFFGSKIEIEQNKFSDKSYRNGIKINDNIIALSSNSVIPEGEDILLFYNISKKSVSKEIRNYSFSVNEHNMTLMKIGDGSENKILICICKKYIKGQKNGILLVNPQLEQNKDIINPFNDTDIFEPYCICPLFNIENKNETKIYKMDTIDKNYKNKIEIVETIFFFVGGYDTEKREGVIRLYKIIKGKTISDTRIKFLHNIEFNINGKFEGFREQIKCMIQSKITGNIIVTTADGKIILFTKPNLGLYI